MARCRINMSSERRACRNCGHEDSKSLKILQYNHAHCGLNGVKRSWDYCCRRHKVITGETVS